MRIFSSKGWLATMLVILFLMSCNTKQDKPTQVAMTKEVTNDEKIVIYQMMTRLFGNKQQTNAYYGTLQENGVGKFNDINNEALMSLKQLGITHVWFTGVIEHAVLTDYTAHGIALDDADVVKGRAGSPYAIKDYYDVNPDLAENVANRMAEFESLLQRTHANGMKILIDFVPNHVARKYYSDAKPAGVQDFGATDTTQVFFNNQNNFYYLPNEPFQVPQGYNSLDDQPFPTKDKQFDEFPAKVTGNDRVSSSPDVNDWFETVKLNYGVNMKTGERVFEPIPDTWQKMYNILAFWAAKGVDGFRCDMAEMVPVEFWEWVIPKVQLLNPDIVFIAEIYNPSAYEAYINQGKFDYLYDKVQLYDTLRHIIEGHGHVVNIAGVIEDLTAVDDHMLRFLENHDEQRIASPNFAGDPYKALPAMALSAAIGKGPVMIYFGQEVGEPGAGVQGFGKEDGRTTIFDYWGVPEHQKWMNDGKFDGALLSDVQKNLRLHYQTILTTVNSSTAFANGKLEVHAQGKRNVEQESVFAFWRYDANDTWLIINNFSDQQIKNIEITYPGWVEAARITNSVLINTAAEAGVQLADGAVKTDLDPFGTVMIRMETERK